MILRRRNGKRSAQGSTVGDPNDHGIARQQLRDRSFGSAADNDIDLEPDELGRDLGGPLAATLRPVIFDRDGATFDPTEFAQPLHKRGDPLGLGCGRARASLCSKTGDKADIARLRISAKLRRDGPVRAVAGFEFRNSR